MRSASRVLIRWRPCLAVVAMGAAAATYARAAPTSSVVDLEGRAVDPLAVIGSGRQATVLVFTRTDCPISNRYAPELRRLHDRFAGRGAAFWLVYPDGSEPVAALREHRRAFGLGFEAVRDPQHALVQRTGATVTPEVAVFAVGRAAPRMVYRGRIDDRTVEFGRTRARPTRRDLADVLESVTAGRAVEARTTTAIGCSIPLLP